MEEYEKLLASGTPPAGKGNVTHKGFGGPQGCSLVILFLIALLLWDSIFMYPLRLLVVLMHETGHALAAILTGGSATIKIFPNEGGVAMTRGGCRFLILSSGYFGSVVFGALLLRGTVVRTLREILLEIMGAAILAVTIFLVGFTDAFTFIYCVAAAAVMLGIGLFTRPVIENFVVRFIAVASCLYAILDIRSDLLSWNAVFGTAYCGQVSDAKQLADLTHIPALIWGVLWCVVSAVVLVKTLRYVAGQDARTTPPKTATPPAAAQPPLRPGAPT